MDPSAPSTHAVNATPPGAIVLGGNFVGLGVARSLGSRGIPVWVFDTDPAKSIAQYSRYVRRFVVYKGDIHDHLLAEGERHGLRGWVVIAVNDEGVEALAIHHEELCAMFRVASPTLELARIALDKRRTYEKAREMGIAVPWTLVTDDPTTVAADLPYPVILKPAVNHHFFPHTNVKALSAAGPSAFVRAFDEMRRFVPADEILIQERVPGGGECQFSFCGAARCGEVYATLSARRRRQYPVEFGNASSFVETIDNEVVEREGRRFLERIGYDGIAEIEFKLDTRDGRHKLLDFNPRPWGWNTLGRAAGVDFIHLLWQQALGLPLPQVPRARRKKWLREITDPLALAKSPRRAAEAAKTLGALARGDVTLAAFSLLDPLPFFAEFVLWLSKGASRQKRAREFKLRTSD